MAARQFFHPALQTQKKKELFMADMCVRMNLFKNWRIWNEEFFTIFLLRSRGVVGTPTCYSAMRCYDDAKASTSNAILSFPLEGLNTFFSSPQPSKSTSRNGFLQHCMMPSTALCYDDSFPFLALLVACELQNVCNKSWFSSVESRRKRGAEKIDKFY